MALITGEGMFVIAGTDTRVYDIDFQNNGGADGALHVNSGAVFVLIAGCRFAVSMVGIYCEGTEVTISDCFIVNTGGAGGHCVVFDDADQSRVDNSYLFSAGGDGVVILGGNELVVNDCNIDLGFTTGTRRSCVNATGDDIQIIGNKLHSGTNVLLTGCFAAVVSDNLGISNTTTPAIELAGATDCVIADNALTPNGDGIILDEAVNCSVTGNTIRAPGFGNAADTSDGIRLDTADTNLVMGNKVVPSFHASNLSRSGINVVSGNDNAVYANYLGEAAEYATADFIDTGTGTITAPLANGQFSY